MKPERHCGNSKTRSKESLTHIPISSRDLSQKKKCRCGCGGIGIFLITGVDYGGHAFIDEPACLTAAIYCEESACELGLSFSKRRAVSL